MKHFFIVLGYGVPKNIMKDLNYSIYLRGVLGHIFDIMGNAGSGLGVVYFCGGSTDFFPPYRRKEAVEMRKLFRHLLDRDALRGLNSRLELLVEKYSFSALESLESAAQAVTAYSHIQKVTVFCELTRAWRVTSIALCAFRRQNLNIKVISVDFDQSDLRFLDLKVIDQREAEEELRAREALSNQDAHEAYLRASRKRVTELRKKAKEHR